MTGDKNYFQTRVQNDNICHSKPKGDSVLVFIQYNGNYAKYFGEYFLNKNNTSTVILKTSPCTHMQVLLLMKLNFQVQKKTVKEHRFSGLKTLLLHPSSFC